MMPEPDVLEPLFALIRSIPRGKVVTYGQAAEGVDGVRLTARMVGSAMRIAPGDVPWHRVVGAGGTLPIGKISLEKLLRQRVLLELEGVRFIPGRSNVIDMARFQWMHE